MWTQPQTGLYVNAIGIKITSFKNIFRGKSFYRKMNKEKFHRNLIFVTVFQLVVASSWRTESDFLFAGWASLYVSRKLLTYPSPKPTLTLTSHLEQNVVLGEGQVGNFPETKNDPRRWWRKNDGNFDDDEDDDDDDDDDDDSGDNYNQHHPLGFLICVQLSWLSSSSFRL